jgi:hypothetical protein
VNKSIKVMAILACMVGGAAHASQVFDFSYTFADGQSLSGTLTGTEVAGGGGAFSVSNVSNVSLTFDGNPFTGTLSAGTFNSAAPAAPWNFGANAAVISTNATANNFIIADSTDPAGNNVNNYFYFVTGGATPSGSGASEVVAFNGNTGDLGIDNPAAGAWSLTVAPVPLPPGLPLLASALGMFGLRAFRRRAAV